MEVAPAEGEAARGEAMCVGQAECLQSPRLLEQEQGHSPQTAPPGEVEESLPRTRVYQTGRQEKTGGDRGDGERGREIPLDWKEQCRSSAQQSQTAAVGRADISLRGISMS